LEQEPESMAFVRLADGSLDSSWVVAAVDPS
jgi:hypothetical protein